MSNFVTDASTVTSGLSDVVNVTLGQPSQAGGDMPMPGLDRRNVQEPAAPPPVSPAPQFADIENFVTAAELSEATRDPARLSSMLQERVARLHEAYAGERDQAEHFRNLMGVPEMREHILAKLEGRNGSAQNGRQVQPPQPSDEIGQLRREMQQLRAERNAQTQGERAVQDFQRTHADMNQHAPAMQRIIQENPGTTLAVAYRLAKFEAGSLRAAQGSQAPPVSERPSAGVGPTSQREVIDALGTSLRDRSRFRTMEDAFAEAVRKTGSFQE